MPGACLKQWPIWHGDGGGRRGMRDGVGGGVSSKFRVEECNPEFETPKPYFQTGGQNKPFSEQIRSTVHTHTLERLVISFYLHRWSVSFVNRSERNNSVWNNTQWLDALSVHL